MLLIKNEKDYTAFVEYSCNSGWCTVQSVNVIAKNDPEFKCEKTAEKLFKRYKKDLQLLYNDIEEYGDSFQKSLI